MEISIDNKSDNNSLNRQEIFCTVSFDKQMPSRAKLRQEIASAAGVDEKLLVIVSAQGAYGTNTAKVIAHSYKDKESMVTAEREHLLMRDGLIEKKEGKKKGKKPASKPESKNPGKTGEKPEEKKQAQKPEPKKESKPEKKPEEPKKPDKREATKPEPKKEEKPKEALKKQENQEKNPEGGKEAKK